MLTSSPVVREAEAAQWEDMPQVFGVSILGLVAALGRVFSWPSPEEDVLRVTKEWEELFENTETGRRIARRTWIEESPKSKEPGQKEKWRSAALFIHMNGNEVENRGNGMEKAMLAKGRCVFMLRVFSA